MRRDERPVVTLVRDIISAVERATAPRPSAQRRATEALRSGGWFDVTAGTGVPQRGQVWLAETTPNGRVAPVVLLQPPGAAGSADSVVAACVVRSRGDDFHHVRLSDADGAPPGWCVNAGRLVTVDAAALVRRVATVTPATLVDIERALIAVLGLGLGVAAATADAPRPRPLPAAPPALPPHPARFEDHPMARLFGQSPPPSGLAVAGQDGGSDLAAVLPELRALVRQRLHRTAPRLELVLDDAAAQGRSVEWTAAAVRATPIRGVMQASLDEIADEMLAIAAGRGNPAGEPVSWAPPR